MIGQFQILAGGAEGERLHGVAQQFTHGEFRRFQLDLARFDLGEVQDFVDDAQQRLAGFQHHRQQFPLAVVQIGVQHQFADSDDRVQRGADLVAHVGQELALGPIGRFGRFARRAHRGDVGDRAGHAGRPAGLVPDRLPPGAEPAVLLRLGQQPVLDVVVPPPFQMGLQHGQRRRAVVGMQPRLERRKQVGELVVGVPQQFLETRRVVHLVGQHVPVPQPVGRAADGQGKSLLAGPQLRRPIRDQPVQIAIQVRQAAIDVTQFEFRGHVRRNREHAGRRVGDQPQDVPPPPAGIPQGGQLEQEPGPREQLGGDGKQPIIPPRFAMKPPDEEPRSQAEAQPAGDVQHAGCDRKAAVLDHGRHQSGPESRTRDPRRTPPGTPRRAANGPTQAKKTAGPRRPETRCRRERSQSNAARQSCRLAARPHGTDPGSPSPPAHTPSTPSAAPSRRDAALPSTSRRWPKPSRRPSSRATSAAGGGSMVAEGIHSWTAAMPASGSTTAITIPEELA